MPPFAHFLTDDEKHHRVGFFEEHEQKKFARVMAARVYFESKFASRLREYRDNSTLDHFRLLNRPCEKPSDFDLNDLKTDKDNPSPQIAERFVGKQTALTIDENLPRSFHLLASKYRVPRSKCFKCNCFLNC